MTPEQFRQFGHQAIDWVADYLANPQRYPVLARVEPGALTDALPARGPEQGEPPECLLADFERLILPAVTHWNHPGFMAYFANTGSAPGILGELLAAALNGNGMLWKSCPAIVELEQVTLRWLRQWTGLPEDWFGQIYDTASVGSMHALAAARQAADPDSRAKGMPSDLVVYASEQAHSSIEKGAIAVGFGQQRVRKVPVDAEFRMRPDALAEMIECDRAAGLRPCAVAATVGTTATTSVDPVPAIAEICRAHEHLAPRGRRLRRLRRGGRGVPLGARRLRARRFVGHQSAQVAVHARGLQRVLYAAPGRAAARVFADARISRRRRKIRAPST